jgi:hypothetical protein
MGVIEVCHEYEIAGIWVSADLAPALSDIPPGSRPRLIIPGWAPDPGAPVPNGRYFNMSLGCHSYMEDGSAYEIRQFVIAIPVELDVPEDYMERWGADHFAELRSHRDATQPRAEALARAFVDWVRTEGAQPRLGRFEDGSVAYGGCSYVQADGERLRTASARALVGHGTTGPRLLPQRHPLFSHVHCGATRQHLQRFSMPMPCMITTSDAKFYLRQSQWRSRSRPCSKTLPLKTRSIC